MAWTSLIRKEYMCLLRPRTRQTLTLIEELMPVPPKKREGSFDLPRDIRMSRWLENARKAGLITRGEEMDLRTEIVHVL